MGSILKPGDRIHEYRLTDDIGVGGTGVVFKAVDDQSGDIVAIKAFSPGATNRRDFAARFERACKLYPRIRHPHIVRVRRAGVTQLIVPAAGPSSEAFPVSFIVMDLVEGTTLRKILDKRRPVDFLGVLHTMIQVADAMRFAHSNGILHLGLKPENIMVGTVGDERGHVWIMDLGVANSGVDESARVQADDRTDIYAFGLIFYEAIAGARADPTPVPELVSHYPDCVWPMIANCVAIDRATQYQSFDDVLTDLRAAARESTPPPRPIVKRVAAVTGQ